MRTHRHPQGNPLQLTHPQKLTPAQSIHLYGLSARGRDGLQYTGCPLEAARSFHFGFKNRGSILN